MGSSNRRLVETGKRSEPEAVRYVAPRSPHMLLQEDLEGDPWKILVCCVMLNCTTRKQMEPVMWEFFQKWPGPKELVSANQCEVAEQIKSLGFKNRRTERLVRMSREFIALVEECRTPGSQKATKSPTGEIVPSGGAIRELHGVGEYAARAYEMFCLGHAGDKMPDDGPLTKYWCFMTGNPLPEGV